MKILLIDDDPDIRQIGELALRSLGGFDVSVAASGPEGITAAQADPPDAILLDMMMPGMDGVTTLAALRRDPALDAVPVLFFTAKIQRNEVEEFLLLGAAGVVEKPFDPMTLAATVLELLGRVRESAATKTPPGSLTSSLGGSETERLRNRAARHHTERRGHRRLLAGLHPPAVGVIHPRSTTRSCSGSGPVETKRDSGAPRAGPTDPTWVAGGTLSKRPGPEPST